MDYVHVFQIAASFDTVYTRGHIRLLSATSGYCIYVSYCSETGLESINLTAL